MLRRAFSASTASSFAVLALVALAGCTSDSSPAPTGDGGGGGNKWRAVVGSAGLFGQTFDDARWATRHLDAARLDGVGLLAVACYGNLDGWAVGDGGTIAHTTDGGQTWAAQDAHLGAASLRAVRFADPMHGIVAGDAGALAVTDDAGATWRPVSLAALAPLGGAFGAFRGAAASGDLRVVIGDRGAALRSLDAGRTWQTIAIAAPAGATSDLRAVTSDAQAHVVYAVDAAGGIWSSADRAATFVHEATAGVALEAIGVADTGSPAIAVGANGTALVRDAATGAWRHLATGTTAALHAALVTESGAYVAGDDGTLLVTRDLARGAWSKVDLGGTTERLNGLEDL